MEGLKVGQLVIVTDFPNGLNSHGYVIQSCIDNGIPLEIIEIDDSSYSVRGQFNGYSDDWRYYKNKVEPFFSEKCTSFCQQKYFYMDNDSLKDRLNLLMGINQTQIVKEQIDCIKDILKSREW